MTTPREEPSIYVHGPYDQPPTRAFTPTPLPAPIPPQPPAVRGNRRPWVIAIVSASAAVLVLAMAATAAVWFFHSAGRMTVNGAITIRDASGMTVDSTSGDVCSGQNGYDDIAGGAEVNITDAGSATVALGQLQDGHYSAAQGCVFHWTVTDVPTGKKFYGVTIGRRPAIKLPEAQMRQLVALSLG